MHPILKFPIFAKFFKPWVFGLIVTVVLSGSVAFYSQHRRENTKDNLSQQTVVVESENLVIPIKANGSVQALKRINLGPENSGKVANLYVGEGDKVQKGQIIARMTSELLEAQVNQYKALVLKAEADLAQKRSGNRPEEIAQGQARLLKAEFDLKQLQNSIPQEIKQIEAQLRVAIAEAKLAKIKLSRFQKLAKEGAIAKNRLDELETDYKTAFASQQEVEQKLEQLQKTKHQDVAQTKASLEEAEQAFKQLKNGSRPQEITQSEAEVAHAKAQLDFYQRQLNNTTIRAPFAGIITRRFAQEGDFVTPTTSASDGDGATSTSIVELSSGLEIEANISEANISKIQVGQKVEVYTDTFPDEIFKGKVSIIAPRAILHNNLTTFRVKISLQSGQEQLKSGMNVRLNMQTNPIENALVIPLSVVVTETNGDTGVYVPDAKIKTRFQKIDVGVTSGDKIQVTQGLKEGDRIFTTPPSHKKIEGVDTFNF
jgi:HlyD family secretion protein